MEMRYSVHSEADGSIDFVDLKWICTNY